MTVSRETTQLTDTGRSPTHRDEARRLAQMVHEGVHGQKTGLTDTIALARLHAELALLDTLDEIKLGLQIIATARR